MLNEVLGLFNKGYGQNKWIDDQFLPKIPEKKLLDFFFFLLLKLSLTSSIYFCEQHSIFIKMLQLFSITSTFLQLCQILLVEEAVHEPAKQFFNGFQGCLVL